VDQTSPFERITGRGSQEHLYIVPMLLQYTHELPNAPLRTSGPGYGIADDEDSHFRPLTTLDRSDSFLCLLCTPVLSLQEKKNFDHEKLCLADLSGVQ